MSSRLRQDAAERQSESRVAPVSRHPMRACGHRHHRSGPKRRDLATALGLLNLGICRRDLEVKILLQTRAGPSWETSKI
jgi:hypothetical protein